MALKISRPTKNFERPLTTDYQTQFLSFMGEQGMEPDPKRGLVVDGSIGRAYVVKESCVAGINSGWSRVFPMVE